MPDAVALALGGMPPVGRGVYARASVPAGPWDFYCINGFRSDARAQLARVGGGWLYGMPEEFRPDTWRRGLSTLLERARAYGATGIIVDGEGGWPEVEGRAAKLRELGNAMRVASHDVRIGFTSYPHFPDFPVLADAAGINVWYSVQIYGRTSQDPAAFRAWFARWRQAVGQRLTVSAAGWDVPGSWDDSDAGFRAYLANLPHSCATIVWTTGELPPHQRAAYESYHPGGSLPGTWGYAVAAFAARPQGAAVLAAIGALVLVLWLVLRSRA